MGDAIQANYEALKQIGTKFTQISDDLAPHRKKLADLGNELDKHWQGEAADKFTADEGSGFWQPFSRLTETLQAASERIDKIVQILHAAEEEAGNRQKAKAS